MKKFLFLGAGFLSLGTVFVLQADAQQGCYYAMGSSRLSCARTTSNCSYSSCGTTQVGCYTGCYGTNRPNLVYRQVRQVRQVPTTNCSYSYCNNYSYRTDPTKYYNTPVNYYDTYNTQRSVVNYRTVSLPVIPVSTCGNTNNCYNQNNNAYSYRSVARPVTNPCYNNGSCGNSVSTVVRPVTYNSYYPSYSNNSASNRVVIVNVN